MVNIERQCYPVIGNKIVVLGSYTNAVSGQDIICSVVGGSVQSIDCSPSQTTGDSGEFTITLNFDDSIDYKNGSVQVVIGTQFDETVYQQSVPTGGHGVEMESVGGRSVVWNQLVTNGNFADESGWSVDNATLSVENSVCEISYSTVWGEARQPIQVKSGHKYYISLLAKKPFAETVGFGLGDGVNVSTEGVYIVIPQSSDFSRVSKIGTFTDKGSDTNRVLIKCMGTIPSDSMFVKSVVVIDLTLLGMSDITSTSDPRIAWIEAYASEHPEYNAGEVVHGAVEEIEEEGKNLLASSYVFGPESTYKRNSDGSVEILSADGRLWVQAIVDCGVYLPAGTYTFSVNGNARLQAGNASASYSSATNSLTFTLSEKAKICFKILAKTGGTYPFEVSNIQLERGSTATTYSPYHHTTYPIPAEVQALEGYGWEGNYIDFKRKKFVKAWDRVDMGTLTWTYLDSNHFYYSLIEGRKAGSANLVCEKFVSKVGQWEADATEDIIWGNPSNATIYVRTTSQYSSATAFKAAMSGVMLYYELATSIETDISAYIDDSWQAIPTEPNGSITFQNDNLLPVPVKGVWLSESGISHIDSAQFVLYRDYNDGKLFVRIKNDSNERLGAGGSIDVTNQSYFKTIFEDKISPAGSPLSFTGSADALIVNNNRTMVRQSEKSQYQSNNDKKAILKDGALWQSDLGDAAKYAYEHDFFDANSPHKISDIINDGPNGSSVFVQTRDVIDLINIETYTVSGNSSTDFPGYLYQVSIQLPIYNEATVEHDNVIWPEERKIITQYFPVVYINDEDSAIQSSYVSETVLVNNIPMIIFYSNTNQFPNGFNISLKKAV